MSRVSTTRGYKGRGRFTLRPIAGGRPFELGNVVSLSETIESERDARVNYQDAAGGELDVDEIISSVTFELVANDISPQNLAIGSRGTATQVASGAIVDEPHVAWDRLRVAFANIPDPDVAVTVAIVATTTRSNLTAYVVGDTIIETGRAYVVTVAGTTGAAPPTYPTNLGTVVDGTVTWKDVGPTAMVLDTDYTRTPHGILMAAGADTRFPTNAGIPIEVAYTRNAQWIVEALVNSGEEFEIIYHGLNAVDSGNPVIGRYFRVKFSPTSGFNRQGGDTFAELTLTGTVLQDESKTGAGLSKYMNFAMI